MLKINKILSKKIKSPLSLRGAKRRSNLSGFSLIELMIAVTILVMAIFGIFHAYSVGFMGMADARDRTVATNYLRETIEDFKNMDFNKVKDETIALIPGTKFHRGAIVLDLKGEGGNLKKVIAQVRWTNREGNIKTEEASTILYGKLKTSEVSTAAGIIIYAYPYYTILPDKIVDLTAEIKDKNGNTITDWEGDIIFSIVTDPPNSPPVGYINSDPQTIHTTNGTASIIFTAEGESLEGIEKIQAKANLTEVGYVTDTINIRVSTGAVSIILSPAEESLPKDGSTDITVTVVKADYETIAVEYSGEINLTASGPGNLSDTTITITSGVGTVTLTSNGTPGVVEVTASVPDLDMGFTEVTFTGSPEYIKVSAENYSMHIDDSNTITVSIEDINGKEVNFAGTIGLEITGSSTGNGSFNPILLIFSDTSSETSSFEASEVGSVIIKASDQNPIEEEKLTEGDTPYPINISEALVPHHIELYTVFPSVKADGEETSIITATVYDEDDNKVTNYSGTITFYNSGEGFFPNDSIDLIPDNGVATVELSSLVPGTATVTVSSSDGLPFIPEEGVQVEFYGEAVDIVLVANPPYVFIGGENCTITATIVDEQGIKVDDYEGTVNFSITSGGSLGELIGDTEVFVEDGIAEVTLQSTINTGGIVTVMAEEDSLPSFTIDITVKEITLALVYGPVYYSPDFIIVTFNIEIDGPNLNLINMEEIVWDDDSFLNEIGIKTPSTDVSYDRIIDTTGDKSSPYTENNINQVLLSGESTIRLTFNESIENVPIKVTFYINFGEYSGEQLVVFPTS